METEDILESENVQDSHGGLYSFDIVELLTAINPFYWIYMYYYSMCKWIYVDNFYFTFYFCVTCVVLKEIIIMLRKLEGTYYPKKKRKTDNTVSLQMKHMVKELKEEGETTNKGGPHSSKPKIKKVVRGQKKEKIKAKMRKRTPQAGPSGIQMGFELEDEPGPSTSCDDGCGCESCINEVD